MRLILILCLILTAMPVTAQTTGEVTNLPIPRFVSLRGDEVYARKGPGKRYPIKWVYQRENLPVEIVQEFDTWRKIRDIDGEEAWVHQSLLSGNRYGIQNAGQAIPLLRSARDDARAVALIEDKSVLSLKKCQNDWCQVASAGFSGWIPVNSLWGVYEGEQIQ
jgi:SH3-like domain-containing protein